MGLSLALAVALAASPAVPQLSPALEQALLETPLQLSLGQAELEVHHSVGWQIAGGLIGAGVGTLGAFLLAFKATDGDLSTEHTAMFAGALGGGLLGWWIGRVAGASTTPAAPGAGTLGQLPRPPPASSVGSDGAKGVLIVLGVALVATLVVGTVVVAEFAAQGGDLRAGSPWPARARTGGVTLLRF